MRRGWLAVVLLLAACGAPDATGFQDGLQRFANAGLVRVGDLTGGRLDPAQLYGIRECAVLSKPDAKLMRAELEVRLDLCLKPEEEEPLEVASAG